MKSAIQTDLQDASEPALAEWVQEQQFLWESGRGCYLQLWRVSECYEYCVTALGHTVQPLLSKSRVTVFVERGERLKRVGTQRRPLQSRNVLFNLGLDKLGVRTVPCKRNILAILDNELPESTRERVGVLVSRRI